MRIRQSVADAADGGHEAADDAADQGAATAGEGAVIGEGFGEAHGDACTDGGGQADEERRCGCSWVAKAAANSGDRVETDAIHEARQAGLDDLQEEEPAGGFFLRLSRGVEGFC